MRWPGHLEPAEDAKTLAAHVDLLPTLAELCGLDTAACRPFDGRSLVPVLNGKPGATDDRTLFIHDAFGNADGPAAVRTPRSRAVRMPPLDWQLFDVATDPGERLDLATAFPEKLRELSDAYAESFGDVTAGGEGDFPAQIGDPAWPRVTFAAHESRLSEPSDKGGIAFAGGHGWAGDWIADWTDEAAAAEWPVEILAAGTHQVTVAYSCAPEQVGAEFVLTVGDAELRFRIDELCEAKHLPNPDTFERKEVDVLDWCQRTVGKIDVEPGRGTVRPKPSASRERPRRGSKASSSKYRAFPLLNCNSCSHAYMLPTP